MFANFKNKTIGVIGDIMLDHYIIGEVERISPEAPIPILKATEEYVVPGGAANTAANVSALGGGVSLVGVIGNDTSGKRLREELKKFNCSIDGVLHISARPTGQKTRVVARTQQIVRIDREETEPISSHAEKKLIEFLSTRMSEWDGVVVSDYAKGVITPSLASAIIALSRKIDIPLVVDTKPAHFSFFKGASVFTPNLMEAGHIAGLALKTDTDVHEAGRILCQQADAAILITRDSRGMTLFEKGRLYQLPAMAKEVYDVTGAGDTVAAAMAIALAAGEPLPNAARIANVAAGIAVGKRGVATVSLEELVSAMEQYV